MSSLPPEIKVRRAIHPAKCFTHFQRRGWAFLADVRRIILAEKAFKIEYLHNISIVPPPLAHIVIENGLGLRPPIIY
jgi:hypothetical protein